jgi:6-phosphogluconolactonase
MTADRGRRVEVLRDADVLAAAAAEEVARRSRAAVEERNAFCIALSGGNTPRRLYETLAQPPYSDGISWSAWQVFFSDERFVPPDSGDSNYHMADQALLSHVPIPKRQIHRVATENVTPQESAANYAEGLRRIFQVGLDTVPIFDVILLGLGPDGHTASLFPDTDALEENDELVVANFVQKLDTWRITFTYPLINASREVLFLAEGQGKAEMASRALGGDLELPAARVSPRGELVWLLDEAAAAALPSSVDVSRAGPR